MRRHMGQRCRSERGLLGSGLEEVLGGDHGGDDCDDLSGTEQLLLFLRFNAVVRTLKSKANFGIAQSEPLSVEDLHRLFEETVN